MQRLITALAVRAGCAAHADMPALPAQLQSLRSFNPGSAVQQQQPSAGEGGAARKAVVNRLLYRARQRGWLELDLLMGMWADVEVPKMSSEALSDFSHVLDQENPELYKWLTGQEEAPEAMRGNTAFQMLRRHVEEATSKHSPTETRAAQGQAWVRGWDDLSRPQATAADEPVAATTKPEWV